MSSSTVRIGVLMTCSAIVATVLWTASGAEGGTEDSDIAATVKRLTDRIDSVENTIGVDPNQRVLKSVLSRLEETEDAVTDLRRFATGQRPTNQSVDLQRQLL